jgi:hypothetical protein
MGVALYQASQQVPTFYQQALAADTSRQEVASQQMLRQATTLVSETQKPGIWEAEFTDEQVNGWLAVDLVKNHAKSLPDEVSDPRVAILPDGARIGWRWESKEISTVFSLELDLYLIEPNVLALEVRAAQAGTVPLPLSHVLDKVTRAAEALQLPLRWVETDQGHPTALVKIPPPESDDKRAVVIEEIELREGSIFLAGKTVPMSELAKHDQIASESAMNQAEVVGEAVQSRESEKIQR